MSPTFIEQHPAPLAQLDAAADHEDPAGACGGGGNAVSGLAEEGARNGLLGPLAERLAREDARRMEKLNEAIRLGLDAVQGEEETMAKGRQTCGGCGNEGHNRRSCPRGTGKAEKPRPPKEEAGTVEVTPAALARVVRASRRGSDLSGWSVTDLLDQIRACKAELAGRAEALRKDLEAIERETAA